MKEKSIKWKDFEKELNITKEQEEEIRLEMEIIEASIQARENKKISQRELSKLSGIKQPAIARIEKRVNSPSISTLIKLLYPMGYTLKVVSLEEKD